ncbi:MAG: T9SS type A sorting domain-containing protein [Bacteroidetes bacterium]|nr:T9SS type A sorting domain-containing protein [Bacteroidota bacterium]
MEKLYIFMITIFATANIYAQTYTISFAATGTATTVDSVKVENLTHPATATWHAGDVFQLVLGTGINEVRINDDNLIVFPNPMQGQAEISFYARQTGNACLSIYDIAGKEVLQTENKLMQGTQKYQLTGLKQGMYFIHISGNGYFYTAKLISQNTTASETIIKYLGSEKPEVALTGLKSTSATVTMPHTTGDNLRFNGYAANHSAIVNDVPTGSKTITFAFTSTKCPPTLTDIDGNTYNTVSIGSQCWTRENLNTTKYSNGNAIPNVTDSITWAFINTGAYCDYGNTASNSTTYGRLYIFYTVVDARGLCPIGWHVPSDSDWTTLTTFLGGESVAGHKLKEAGITHWASPNTGATNETGFTALPGSNRFFDGYFGNIGIDGFWWSSTENDAINTWSRYVNNNDSNFYRMYFNKNNGFSVRCVRD